MACLSRTHALLVAAIAGIPLILATSIPTCADECVTNALPASCNLAPACICANSTFVSGVSCCASAACSASDFILTQDYVNTICDPVGYNITLTQCDSSTTAQSSTSSSQAPVQGTFTGVTGTDNSAFSASSTSLSSLSNQASSGLASTSSTLTPSSLTTSSSAATSATLIKPSQTSTPTVSHGGGGLSTGAKAGIGVGAAGAAVILVGLAYWLGTRRSTRDAPKNSVLGRDIPGEVEEVKPPYELAGGTTSTTKSTGGQGTFGHSNNDKRHELSAEPEFAATHKPLELPTS